MTNRKEFAENVKNYPCDKQYKGAVFRLYDGREISSLAWKHVEPEGNTPFTEDEA